MRPKIVGLEKTKYESSRLAIRAAKIKFPGKKSVEWEYVEHSGVVGVIPVDKEGNVYLVKEWRLAWKREVLQIPAGVYDGRSEKKRVKQAHNELREETGMDAKRMTKLGSFYGGANIKYVPHLYLARDLFPYPKKPDDDEFVTVVKMPFAKAYKLFVTGKEMTTSGTMIAFFLAKRILG